MNDDNEKITVSEDMMVVSQSFENSSNIAKAEYDPILEALQITFRSGGVYAYVGVPKRVFRDMCMSESAGRFFVERIKNEFDFMKKA